MPRVSYHLTEPEIRDTAVIFASPHSGRDYPQSFLSSTILDAHSIRSSEDAFVDRLFDMAPRLGAPLITGGAPRSFVDLNRGADELDPALIEGVRVTLQNPRVATGLGVIPRVVANGRAIYGGKIALTEALRRIETYWRPYHHALQHQLQETHRIFGSAILIDCHSMPHEAMDSVAHMGVTRPEIVIGDRFGASAHGTIVERIEAAFAEAGLVVARNTPFAGAYSTQHYGRPSRGQHAIQIEIDRSLYMDERLIRPNDNFPAFRRLMQGIVENIVEAGRPDRALAAE